MSDENTAVKTYVPEWQKTEWEDHAERLDMSRSEFVRSMVQAGRRNIEVSDDATLQDLIQEAVEELLAEAGFATYEEIVEVLAADVEDAVVVAIEALEENDQIRYNPQRGGYIYTGTEGAQ
jgi:hypothetical protein